MMGKATRKKKFIFFFAAVLITALFLTSCFSTDLDVKDSSLPPEPVQYETSVQTDDQLNGSAGVFIEYGLIDAQEYTAANYVSRLDAMRIISDITGLSRAAEKSAYTHPFIDISGRAENKIGYLYHYQIIDGVTNNTFMENEICNLDTFLLYLLRALDHVGGQQRDVGLGDAYDTAMAEGLLSRTYEKSEDGLLTMNEAFDICHNALYVCINDTDTLLTTLFDSGIIDAADYDYDEAYEITAPRIEPFYEEHFDDKRISGYDVVKDGTTYWYGSRVGGTKNRITEDGYLQIAGNEQKLTRDQQISLRKSQMKDHESYGMTFTVNLDNMGNEGDESRVIFRAIPRTADAGFTKCYAVNYYMVIPLGEYQSNLARCQWSITNTNAPSGTEALSEAYFLLKEDVDYTARLLIEDTDEGDVHIAFYIDGPDRDTHAAEPLLEYTDTSEYKITKSAAGPAFGNSGYKNFGWGFASRVRFDDISLYDTQDFAALTGQLEKYAETSVSLQDNTYGSQWRYLIDHGVIGPYQHNIDFLGNVSVAQFLASAMYLKGSHMDESQTLDDFVLPEYKRLFKNTEAYKDMDLGRPITRYEAALIIKDKMRGDPATSRYRSLYHDQLDNDYLSAVDYAVQNSYLLLDADNDFNGNAPVSRQDMLRIFCRAVDASLRDENHRLQLPAIWSDNAILQRDRPIPISGRGMSGDTVTVRMNGETRTAKVVDGRWYLELSSQPAGGPYTLTVKDAGYTKTIRGLYVGEVFIVAGQSNAEWSVYESDNNSDTLRKFNNQTRVRLFRPVSLRAATPRYDTETKWEMSYDEYSEHVLGTASAIGVFYVQKLMEINPELKYMKIGIIQMTYGGTSIELFEPDCVNEKNHYIQRDHEFIESGFWNGYMDGITPYGARALMYYQGENSAHIGYQYETLLRDYIWGVRQEFGDPQLPVMLVQLAGYGDNYGQDYDAWPKIREIQMRTANTIDHVGLVTAIDLSDRDPLNIHPTSKRPIGERLAYLAMDMIYGQDAGRRSPGMTGYTREGHTFRVEFNADELVIKEDVLGDVDFEIQDPAGKWTPARAKVEGNTLLVWDDGTLSPLGVRYAWANYPKACLYNGNGLPVLPFNTAKDLNTVQTPVGTDERHLKKPYHLLHDNDAIINLTRNNAFRRVKPADAYTLELKDGIAGQSPGDQIVLLKREGESIGEGGTTQTTVKITAHGLTAGDWIKNIKYDAVTRVTEVIDENTVRVEHVAGQSGGNVFEIYKNMGTVTAE